MRGAEEIIAANARHGAITSHTIGIPHLAHLLALLPAHAGPDDFEHAAVGENALAIGTDSGRRLRFASLRRLYLFRPNAILFRALRDLWAIDEESRPLLAALCALARDTAFRASAAAILETAPGDELAMADFAGAIERAHPGAYAASTLKKAAENAYASWQQTGHLGDALKGRKPRLRATCGPAAAAYALMLGALQDVRGEALFDTLWARILDRPRSELYDLAFAASQRGMMEFRNAGGVVEVGFMELLRPVEGELL